MPTINNLPPLTEATGTIAFPVVDYNTDPDTTRKATFQQFRDYLEITAAVKSVAGKIGEVTLDYTDINGLDSIAHTGLYTATLNVLGGVKIGSGINKIGDGTISVTPYTLNTATASILGGVKIGANLSITGDGTLNASTASNYTLSTATISVLGGVKVGSGISVTDDGTISTVPLTTATTSTLGGVIVGAGIDVDASGVISISTASANFTNNILKINVGEISDHVSGSVQTAPNTAAFQIDRGSALAASINYTDARYFNDNNGEITRGIFYFRSSGTYAMVAVKGLRVNTGQAELNIFGGENPNSVISVKGTNNYETNVTHDDHIPNKRYVDAAITSATSTTATSTTLGGVKIGSGITAIGDGTISVTPYTLSSATDTILGGVKIGSGITAGGDGTISVALSTATSTVLGGVKIGSGLASYGDGTIYVTVGGGSGGSIVTQDEGSTLSTQTSSINFIGAGVTATNIADAITIRIDGGGGGGSSFTGGAVPSAINVLDGTPSSSSATGAMTVVGGIGVGQNSYFGAGLTVKSATATTSTYTGAMTVVGGIGVGGGIFVNNAVTATNIRVTSFINATSTLTGALTVAGGVGVNGSIYVANTVTAASFVNAGAGTPTIQSPTSIILDAQTEVNVLGSPFRLWSRTVSQLNALGGVSAGAMAFCTDESGGAVPVFYDGTNWRRMTDRNIIS
jgi:hypothetical protein